jgi:hypothetical protein
MSQITGNPAAGLGGLMLGAGTTGPLAILFGAEAPSAITDNSVVSASNGSLFININGTTGSTLFVKVAGSWTNLA